MLAENMIHFIRLLKGAGLAVSPVRTLGAIEAATRIDLADKAQFFEALRSNMITRPEHRPVFEACFELFWRKPDSLAMLPLDIHGGQGATSQPQAAQLRAIAALLEGLKDQGPEQNTEIEARLTQSSEERLAHKDFAQMSASEVAEAEKVIRGLTFSIPPERSRRMARSESGRNPDWPQMMRQQMRIGFSPMKLPSRTPKRKPFMLVALCDISGSMNSYSRMLLHFLQALANAPGFGGTSWRSVHVFTFGTRLTNITPALRRKDPDQALFEAGHMASDWGGGTRIGASLEAFNRLWARRLMGQGTRTLLITDGLERDAPERLGREAARLRRYSKRIIWLNPLLRWEGFEPRARGVQALLPHVDAFVPVHNLQSMRQLADVLAAADGPQEPLPAQQALRLIKRKTNLHPTGASTLEWWRRGECKGQPHA